METIEFDKQPIEKALEDWGAEITGIEQIKQRLAEYIGSDTRGGLNIGQNVICVALPTEVFKVQGVVDFDLQISSDGETYSWKNITIAAREKAVTNEDMVVVE